MKKKIKSSPKDRISDTIAESITVKTKMLEQSIEHIAITSNILSDCLHNGGKILLCGNGGSAADSQHIAAELVVRFRSHVNRPALSAISLTTDTSILTACGNDYGFDDIFSRQVEAYGKSGDVLVGISTSGNSQNVMLAIEQAKQKNMITIGLLGGDGGKIKDLCDHVVMIPTNITARIQECHIMVGHIWCEEIEESLFPELCKK